MIDNKIFTYISLILTVFLYSCQAISYKGSLLSEKEIKEMKDKNNYHAKEANAIIDYNKKKKHKRDRIAKKQRKDEQEYLESLNQKTSKAKRIKHPVPVDFY